MRNGAVELLVIKEDGCVRVAERNEGGFSQDTEGDAALIERQEVAVPLGHRF